ncbi:esterase-like activity of phytase family protein [Campylobacterota bacterium]
MHDIAFAPESFNPQEIRGIKILDAKELQMKEVKGLDFTGISDLAYDKKHGLFALSDKGYAFRLDLEIKNKKIARLNILDSFWLKNKKSEQLPKKKSDAEGMDFYKDSLVISFERRPRVSLFNLNGVKLKNYDISPVLKDIRNYQGKNSALESVTIHPEFGMITAAQKPLKHVDQSMHTLFSQKQRWHFSADADVTAIQSMPDGSLLILEREFRLFGLEHTLWLKKVPIMECESAVCPAQTLAVLKSIDGWELDNFEGLTHIEDDMYLMISDDNDSFLQKCIIVLFQVR